MRRLGVTAALALSVHCALVGFFWSSKKPLPAAESLVDVPLVVDDLPLEDEAVASELSFVPGQEPSSRGPVGASGPAGVGQGNALATNPAVAGAPPGGHWTFSAFRDAPLDLAPPPPEALAPSTVRSIGGLSRALHANDVARGFGTAGWVLSVTENEVRAHTTMIDGTARFEATVDGAGRLVVVLADASKDRAAWQPVTARIASAIDPRKLHVPPGSTWRAVVEVEVRLQYPDGTLKKELGTTATVSAGSWDGSTTPDALPGLTVSHRGKVCSVGANLGPAGLNVGGGCSPENVGAVAQRIVRGHVLEEELL